MKNFHDIIKYWQDNKYEFCSNCSYVYFMGLCPCKIEHINNEIKDMQKRINGVN